MVKKNPYSLIGVLGKITGISAEGRNYQIQLLNKKSVTRQIHQIVPTQANFNICKNQSIDPFQLPDTSEIIVPSMVSSKFDLNIDKFDIGCNQSSNDTDRRDPVSDTESDLNITAFDFRPPGTSVPDNPVHDVVHTPLFPVVPYVPQDSQDLLPVPDQSGHADEADDAVGDENDTI